ncbi:enhancer of mRNA-decapping protein [Anaeramoeba flamelloides]|uniref:Enhancer of mRNA-decapping protein n=1 Tax=Anaeramoeba flamelloides TaxID=1746091 RepID=A0ABQ8Y352_9EUKA|nr:enhancer of mRNA-decapping protein [Anaeramoeba flamelloides]
MNKPLKINTALISDQKNKKTAKYEVLSLTPRMNTNDNWEILHDPKPRSVSNVTVGTESYKVGVNDLHSKRITMGLHEYFYDSSKRLALNNNYLCYPVKDNSNRVGSIRVINRNNNRRALIPGHKDTIIDLGFNSEEDDLLVSVSIDGILNLWMIMEIKGEIRHGLTFSVRYTGSVGCDLKNSPNENEKNSQESKNKNKKENENEKEKENENEKGNDNENEKEKEKENEKEKKMETEIENEKKKKKKEKNKKEKKGYFTKVVWDSRRQNILATITTDNTIIVWNVLQYLSNTSEKIQVFESSKVEKGAYFLSGHTKKIMDLAFEPNKKILASTSEDGTLQIWDYKQQKCLKKIIPHDGSPVNSIIYCGNPLKMNLESFNKELSKFALTGGKNNSEIKLWDIENWSCLQTIKFLPPISKMENNEDLKFAFQIYLDATSQFIIVIDTLGQFFYVLHLNNKPLKKEKFKISKRQNSDNTTNSRSRNRNRQSNMDNIINSVSRSQSVNSGKIFANQERQEKEFGINFDYLTKFYVSQPIYSVILENIKNQKKSSSKYFPFDINMFCITSTSIEKYILKSELIDSEEIKNSLNNKEQLIAKLTRGSENDGINFKDRSESKKEELIKKLLNNMDRNLNNNKINNKLEKEQIQSRKVHDTNSKTNKFANGEDEENSNHNNYKIKNNENDDYDQDDGDDGDDGDDKEEKALKKKNNDNLLVKKEHPTATNKKANKKKYQNVWKKSKKKKKMKNEKIKEKINENTKNIKEERTNIRIKRNNDIKGQEIMKSDGNNKKMENGSGKIDEEKGEKKKDENIDKNKEKEKNDEQDEAEGVKVKGRDGKIENGEMKTLKFQLEKLLNNFEKNIINKTNNKIQQIKEKQNIFIEEKIQNVETDTLLNTLETGIKQTIGTVFKTSAFSGLKLALKSIPEIKTNHQKKSKEIAKSIEILLNNNCFLSEIMNQIIQKVSNELLEKINMLSDSNIKQKNSPDSKIRNENFINYEKLEKKIKDKLFKKFNSSSPIQNLLQNIKITQKGSFNEQNHNQLFTILNEQWNAFNLQINEKLDQMKLNIYQHLEKMTTFWDGPKGISQFLLDVEMYNQALAVVFQSNQNYDNKEQLIVWCLRELEKRGVFHSQTLSFDLIIIDLLFNFCSLDLDSGSGSGSGSGSDSNSENYFEIKTRVLLNIILNLDGVLIEQLLPRLENLIQKLNSQYNKIVKRNKKNATELKKLIFIIKSKQKIQKKK